MRSLVKLIFLVFFAGIAVSAKNLRADAEKVPCQTVYMSLLQKVGLHKSVNKSKFLLLGDKIENEENLPAVWKNYNREFQNKLRIFLRNEGHLSQLKNDGGVIRRLLRSGRESSYLEFLKDLGLKISVESWHETPGSYLPKQSMHFTYQGEEPNFHEIVKEYFLRMKKAVDARRIPQENVFIPAFPYKNIFGKVIPVPYGEKPPKLSWPVGLLSDEDFLQFIQKGYFPIAGIKNVVGTFENHPVALHDLAHLVALSEYAEEAALIFEKIKYYNPPKSKGKMDVNMAKRLDWIIEYLFALKISDRDPIHHLWMLPKSDKKSFKLTVPEVNEYLAKMRKDDLEKFTNEKRRLLNEIREVLNSKESYQIFGGVALDPFFTSYYRIKGRAPEDIFHNLWIYSSLEEEETTQLANLQVALLRFNGISMKDWIDEFLEPNLDKGENSFYRIFCGGEFSKGSLLGSFANKICK